MRLKVKAIVSETVNPKCLKGQISALLGIRGLSFDDKRANGYRRYKFHSDTAVDKAQLESQLKALPATNIKVEIQEDRAHGGGELISITYKPN